MDRTRLYFSVETHPGIAAYVGISGPGVDGGGEGTGSGVDGLV